MSAFVSLRRLSNNVSTFQRGYLGFISLFDIPTGILEKGCIQTCSEHQMNFNRKAARGSLFWWWWKCNKCDRALLTRA